jgi:hypothetical protein
MEQLDELDPDTKIGSYTLMQIKSILKGSNAKEKNALRIYLNRLLKHLRLEDKKVHGGYQLDANKIIAIILIVLGSLGLAYYEYNSNPAPTYSDGCVGRGGVCSDGRSAGPNHPANEPIDVQPAGYGQPANSGNFANLLNAQHQELQHVLVTGFNNGVKAGCWMWWVFPHDTVGGCDKYLSGVPADKIGDLFLGDPSRSSIVEIWMKIASKIKTLLNNTSLNKIFPKANDQGRLLHFINFWSSQGFNSIIPHWFTEFITALWTCKDELLKKTGGNFHKFSLFIPICMVIILILVIILCVICVNEVPDEVKFLSHQY